MFESSEELGQSDARVNLRDLERLVAGGESEQLELKKSTGQLREAMHTVCGMLNGNGGFVVFGVTPDLQINGQLVSERTLTELHNEFRLIEPPTFPQVETLPLPNGQTVIVLSVPGISGSEVFSWDGRPYQRSGPTTTRMPRERYERLLVERSHGLRRWETQPAEGLGIEDLDTAEIVVTVEEAIRRGRLDDPGTRDPALLLRGLNLVHEGQLLNAAVVLFAREDRILPSYPQCLLRMARFRGVDTNEFIDNRHEYGNTFDLLLRAQRFLRDHLPIAGRVIPGVFERIDDPLYPLEALREALANALCHRDYSVPGGSVSIAVFDDRLEITSTGRLPFGLTPDDLTRPHQSLPWNPLIARTFFRRGIIEEWGRGTLKMVEVTTQAGLAAPEFEAQRGIVIVRFRPSSYVPPSRVNHDLSDLQQQLLVILSERGPIALRDIRRQLDPLIPEATVRDNLQMLQRLGLASASGRGQGARWLLVG